MLIDAEDVDPEHHARGFALTEDVPSLRRHAVCIAARSLPQEHFLTTGEAMYLSHFATCPNRKQHRRPR